MCNLKQEDIHDYHESQRIKSLKQVKKKILYKQILIGLSSIVLLFVLGFGIMTGLKKEIEIVNPDNCVSVSMINDSLTTRLQGSLMKLPLKEFQFLQKIIYSFLLRIHNGMH